MDKTLRPSTSAAEDYWQQRYWGILEQNKGLREELESVKSQLSLALTELEAARHLLSPDPPSQTTRRSLDSNPLSDTLELSRSSHMEDMLRVVCTSNGSINLSLSSHFSARLGKSGGWETFNQRTAGLDLRESLFPIVSLGEREEDSIEVADCQSSNDRLFEEFMVLGVRKRDGEPEILLQYPGRDFGQDS